MTIQPKRVLLKLLFLAIVLSVVSTSVQADDLTVYAYRDDFYRETKPGEWTLRLNFNKPVFASNLKQALSVTSGNASIATELLDVQDKKTGNEGLTEFHLISRQSSTVTTPVVVKVKKGFSDITGRLRLAKEFSYTFIPAQQLSILEVEPYYNGKADKGVVLTLSDPCDGKDLEKSLKISPHVASARFVKETNQKYRITGNFKHNENYTLESLVTPVNSGRFFMQANTFSFVGPGLDNRIASQTSASIVELKSRQLFPVSLSGVTTLRAELTRIPAALVPDVADLIVDGASPDEKSWGWIRETYETLVSNGIVNRQFLREMESNSDAFFSPESRDRTRPYSLPLSFRKKPDQGGAWLMQLSDADNPEKTRYAQLVQVTDMSISYKLSGDSLLIWVTSISEGMPLANLELMLKNKAGASYSIGKTDQNGLMIINNGQEVQNVSGEEAATLGKAVKLNLADVTWVIAAAENDSSAIRLDNFRIKPFVWNQQTDSQQSYSRETGYLFTERGIYRPGEPVYFKFLSRIYENDKIVSPEGRKVKVEIVGPRGDMLYSKQLELNAYGSCSDEFKSESYMPLGTYTINTSFLGNGDNKRQYSQPFLLQQFKEPRHLVSLSLKTQDRQASEYIGQDIKEEVLLVDVSCRYYAGGPVRNGRVRWKVDMVPATNKVKGYENFFFGNSSSDTRFLESGESNLNGQGNMTIRIPLDSRLLTGIYGVKVSVTALDIDGEPATEVTTFNPRPKYMVGLSEHPAEVQSGYLGTQSFVVLGPEGKTIGQVPVKITWLQKRFLNFQKRDDQGNMVESWEEGWLKKYSSSQTATNGEGDFEVELNQPGDYMVNVSFEKGDVTYSSQTTYSVGWEDYERWMRSQGPALSKSFGEMVLSLDGKEFESGDDLRASSTVTKPVRKILATVERDKIFEAKVFDADSRNIKFSLPMASDYRPNVFIGVMAPSARKNFPVYYNQADSDIPTIFSGYANAKVRSEIKRIKLEIEPGQKELKARPGAQTSIRIVANDQSGNGVKCEMAVCVVNEAVLALTGFKTPDLSSLADFNLALSVFTGDLRVGLVSQDLLKILGTRPVTGGGVGSGLVTPSLRKDFRPVAFFNSSIITNDAGEADVNFSLPDTTTAYRVYVVAADKTSGFASAQKNLVTSKEFSLEPSTPRFLCYGDKAIFPLVLNNATQTDGSARIEAQGSDGFKIKLKDSSMKIGPHSNASTDILVYVDSGMEDARISLTGQMKSSEGTFNDAIEKMIPIASKLAPIKVSQTGSFTAKTDLKAEFPDYVRSIDISDLTGKVFSASLDLSHTNWSRITPGLKYLMAYPFGCVEQTSSAVFPLVSIKTLVAQGVIPDFNTDQVDGFVKAAIDRILSMQLSSGAFSYWPRQNYASFWGTVYATYALEKSRQAGYAVPQESLKKALKHIRDALVKPVSRSDQEEDQDWIKGWAILTLAEGNSLTHQDFEPIFKNYSSADDETKALLLLTAKKIGFLSDVRLKNEIKSMKITDQSVYPGLKGSVLRRQAAQLMALMAIEGPVAQTDNLAGRLIRELKPDAASNSTADTGWALLALSQYYAAKTPSTDAVTDVTVHYGKGETKNIKLGKTGSHIVLPPETLLKNSLISISANSKNLVNYSFNFVYPEKEDELTPASSGMEISKTIENVNGKKDIRLGDIVKVTLDINLSGKKTGSGFLVYEYVAIEDFVPAGLFAINTRILTEGADNGNLDDQPGDTFYGSNNMIPSHVEFSDEGVRVFKNKLSDGNYRFSYLARAVTQGEFWMRGSRLSLMYDSSRNCKSPGRKIVIGPPE